MSKKENKEKELKDGAERLQDAALNAERGEAAESQETRDESQESIEALQARIAELEDKNLRMMAEFDNYRKRTNKEKLDLMATAGERIFKDMLPLVDDFERAINVQSDDVQSTKEGIQLIYKKFLAFLAANDVHAIETEGADFNTDEHEAVTTFAAGEDKKGKVIDCTQKGYKLGEKVIRFAKVVVGE